MGPEFIRRLVFQAPRNSAANLARIVRATPPAGYQLVGFEVQAVNFGTNACYLAIAEADESSPVWDQYEIAAGTYYSDGQPKAAILAHAYSSYPARQLWLTAHAVTSKPRQFWIMALGDSQRSGCIVSAIFERI